MNARDRHEALFSAAGYRVEAIALCPEPDDLAGAAVVISDVASFYWLREQRLGRIPPMVVLAGDDKAGVTACLCGAAAWAPIDSDPAYLVDAVEAVLRPTTKRSSSPGRDA